MKKGHILLIIMLLIITIGCIWFYLKKPNTEDPIIQTQTGTPLEEVTDRNNYYMVKNCVNKIYQYYANMFNSKEDSDIEKTYILLDEEYINFKKITKENILEELPVMRDVVVNVTSMWSSKQTDDISIYIVKGILREELTNQLTDFQMMVKIDSKNETFSIFLQDYLEEKYNNITLGDTLKVDKLTNLETNRYNIYILEEISDQTYVLDLFAKYKEEALYNTELAYEHLDKVYRSAKFGTLQNFKQYVIENKDDIKNGKITKYQITEEKEYICIDENGRYYIFRENGLMSYSIILDNYTIDLPQFLEKYNSVNSVKKVGYNIQKCIDAINNKDYAYVYDKLDFEFKALNYPVIENFEKELKSKLFNSNEVKDVSSFYEGETHIFKLIIADVKDNTKEQKMTVIMQLKEGTDFVMSLTFE